MFKHKYFFSIFLVFLSSSCVALPVSDSLPSITPSKTPSAIVTPNPTFTKQPELTPPPTFDPYINSIDSPDGNFSVKIHINLIDQNEKPFIEIWDKSGKPLWRVDYQYSWNPDAAPNDNLTIYGWSKDSSKVYFYYSFGYDGSYTLFNGSNLQSIDAYTGEVKDVISGCCIAFDFTPDMNKITYTNNGRVGILDLITGKDNSVKIFPHQYEQAGWVYISPSSEKVIFHTLFEYAGTAIFLDANTMNQKIIMEKYFIETMQFDGWAVDESPRYLELGKDVFTIDLNTFAKIVVGTPTPRP